MSHKYITKCHCKNLLTHDHHVACPHPAMTHLFKFLEENGYREPDQPGAHITKDLPNGNQMKAWCWKMSKTEVDVSKWEEGKYENGKWFKKSFGSVIIKLDDPGHMEKFKDHVLNASKVKLLNRQEDWENLWDYLAKRNN